MDPDPKTVLGQLKIILDNPIVGLVVDFAREFFIGKIVSKHEQGDKATYVLNDKWLRAEASKLFANSFLDENLLRQITYSKHLKVGVRVELFDKWGPNPADVNPDPSLGQVGENQWADFRLALVEELLVQKGSDNVVMLTGPEKESVIQDLCAFLTELAKLPAPYRLQRLVKLSYCKAREDDYKIVHFEKLRGVIAATLKDFVREVKNWLTDPGPTGYASLARQTANGVFGASVSAYNTMSAAATTINNTAASVNTETNRWSLGSWIR